MGVISPIGIKVCFIAPSTSLAPSDQPVLERSVRILTESFETSGSISALIFTPPTAGSIT